MESGNHLIANQLFTSKCLDVCKALKFIYIQLEGFMGIKHMCNLCGLNYLFYIRTWT